MTGNARKKLTIMEATFYIIRHCNSCIVLENPAKSNSLSKTITQNCLENDVA